MWEKIVELDRQAFRFLNGLGIDDLNGFWLFVTEVRNWIPLYLLLVFLVIKIVPKYRNLAGAAGIFIVAFSTLYLTNIVKELFARLRPNNEPLLMDSIRILQRPENFSFWSGHSAVSFAVTTFVVLLLRNHKATKWVCLIYVWPILFAFSRIFVGVHYPADVTVGMLVGLLLGYVFYRLILLFKVRGSTSGHL